MAKVQEEELLLNEQNIDIISARIHKTVTDLGLDNRVALQTRFSAETILLKWLESVPKGTKIHYSVGKWLGRNHIFFKLEGKRNNPLDSDANDQLGEFFNSMVTNIATFTEYSYTDGYNVIDMKLPRPPIGDVGKVAIAVFAALVIGLLLQQVMDADTLKLLNKRLVDPLFNTIMNLLGAVATFIVFTSVVSGIGCMGNVSVLKDTGLRFVKQVLKGLFLTLTVFGIACPFLFNMLKFGGSISADVFFTIYDMFLGCIPSNFISPFATGNTLQVVFMGVAIGIMTLILGQEVDVIRRLVNQINALAQMAMGYLCNLVPLIVFLSFFGVMLQGSFMQVLNSWKIVVGVSVFSWLAILGSAFMTARSCKLSFMELLKNFLPVTIMATISGSPASCYQTIEQICTKTYGIQKGVLDFSLPMGTLLCKKGNSVYFMVIVAGVCELANTPISVGEILLLILTSGILGIACPAVPGAALAILGIFFDQFHLPQSAMSMVIPIMFLIDMTSCGGDTTCMVHDIVRLAHDLKRHTDTPAWKE